MKILFICDTTRNDFSGGKVVRFLTKLLKKHGHEVKLIVCTDKTVDTEWDSFYTENDVIFIPQRDKRSNNFSNLLFLAKGLTTYRNKLKSFSPNIVHFASFDSSKPVEFISEAKKTGAKVILQPWIMDFYCAQGFGYRNNEKCTLCANGNYYKAIKHKCISTKWSLGQVKRMRLQKVSQLADVFLSSNTDLDQTLIKYGIPAEKISRFPVPFDCNIVDDENNKEIKGQDHFSFYGQLTDFKGYHEIIDIFSNYTNSKLNIYPHVAVASKSYESKNISIIEGYSWSNGLLDTAIKSSIAVLIPSLWPTTCEYALFEALLRKIPVILFNVGAHKDLFVHRHNAIVIDPIDKLSFAKGIHELETNPDLRRTIGENGFQTLKALNDPKKLYDKLIEVYDQ